MGPMAYNAFKAGLVTHAKQLSQALGADNIRVNVVSPGPILFPGGAWENIGKAMPDLYKSHIATQPQRPVRHARGSGQGGRLPGQPGRQLGHRRQPRGGRGYTKRVQL